MFYCYNKPPRQHGCVTCILQAHRPLLLSQPCHQHLQIQRFPGNTLGCNLVPIKFLESMNRTGLFSMQRFPPCCLLKTGWRTDGLTLKIILSPVIIKEGTKDRISALQKNMRNCFQSTVSRSVFWTPPQQSGHSTHPKTSMHLTLNSDPLSERSGEKKVNTRPPRVMGSLGVEERLYV